MGVLRDTARAPQPPTNPPTGHHMSVNVKEGFFWAKFGRFWVESLNFYGKKTPRHLVRIVFGRAWDHIGRKDPKSQFSTKFGRLSAKNPNFYESK